MEGDRSADGQTQTKAQPGSEDGTLGTVPPERARVIEDVMGGGQIHPQQLLRIASVTHEVLEEVRRLPSEQAAVAHLRRLHGRILRQLERALPPGLYRELRDLTPDIEEGSLEELSVAHAEILGWLEGLFQGTQLALQLEAARAFREQMRSELPTARAEKTDPSRAETPYL